MAKFRFKSTRPRGRGSYSGNRRGAVDRKRLTTQISLLNQKAAARSFPLRSLPCRHKFSITEGQDRVLIAENSTAGTSTGVMTFTLAQCEGQLELTKMYDTYVIKQVEVEFAWAMGGVTDTRSVVPPRLEYMFDADGGSDNIDVQLRASARSQTRILDPARKHIIAFKPAVLTEIYKSAIATSYAPKFDQTLDLASADVPHWGLKWRLVFPAVSTINVGQLTARCRYHVEMISAR